MLIRYEDNPDMPGQGRFVLTALPRDLGDPAGLTFGLRRTRDSLCLGPDGWTRQEAWLSPEGVVVRGDQVDLELGPAVAGQLARNNSYRFALRTTSGRDIIAVLRISGQPAARSYSWPEPRLEPISTTPTPTESPDSPGPPEGPSPARPSEIVSPATVQNMESKGERPKTARPDMAGPARSEPDGPKQKLLLWAYRVIMGEEAQDAGEAKRTLLYGLNEIFTLGGQYDYATLKWVFRERRYEAFVSLVLLAGCLLIGIFVVAFIPLLFMLWYERKATRPVSRFRKYAFVLSLLLALAGLVVGLLARFAPWRWWAA